MNIADHLRLANLGHDCFYLKWKSNIHYWSE